MRFDIKDYEKYRKKENVVIGYDLAWRKGHIYALIFAENKELMRGKILYLGCNNGTSCCILSKYCERLVGVDINEEALAVAKQLVKREDVTNITFIHANFCNMPFEDKTFDGVYGLHVMEHIFPEDQQAVLGEIKRVLKKGKPFFVQMPTPQEAYYKDKDGMHVFFFESEEMIRKHFGRFFKIEKIYKELRANPGRPSEKHNDWAIVMRNE